MASGAISFFSSRSASGSKPVAFSGFTTTIGCADAEVEVLGEVSACGAFGLPRLRPIVQAPRRRPRR